MNTTLLNTELLRRNRSLGTRRPALPHLVVLQSVVGGGSHLSYIHSPVAEQGSGRHSEPGPTKPCHSLLACTAARMEGAITSVYNLGTTGKERTQGHCKEATVAIPSSWEAQTDSAMRALLGWLLTAKVRQPDASQTIRRSLQAKLHTKP